MSICSPPRLATVAVALVPLVAPAGAAAAPLRPTADFSVSAARPLSNYGGAKRLVVARKPRQRAFLRFVLGAPLRPGMRLTLRLYPLRDAPSGVALRHASDRAWSELSESFRTAPRTGPRTVASGPLLRNRWATIDVTPLATRAATVSFAVETSSVRPVVLASRETGMTAPKLVVVGAPPSLPGQRPSGPGGPALPGLGPALGGGSAPPGAGRFPTPDVPCGITGAPPAWRHVVWIVMENKSYERIVGSPDAPYINSLAARCGLATNYFALVHPSVPNYIGLVSGDTQAVPGTVGPSTTRLAGPSIFTQVAGNWRALVESMPANCALSTAGLYMSTHNPAAYFADVAGQCAAQDVALGDPPDLSAAFTFVTPNRCSVMHDCPVASGDAWLAQVMPKLLATPEYLSGNTAIFLTWDEDDGSAAQHVATVVVSPSTAAGRQDAMLYNHYSLLRTTEEMLGLPLLANAATATSMRAGLGL